MRSMLLRGHARYRYYFTRSTEPTNEELGIIRTDLDGVPIASDQLGTVAFARHQTRFGFDIGFEITERISFNTRVEWRPSWRYPVNRDAQVCSLATDCVTADGVEDPQTFSVVTLFWPGIDISVLDELSVGFGYTNLANQIGPDGRRRNIFYSPDAAFYLSLEVHLDELYKTVAGPKPSTAGSVRPDLARR
jgi:hypothetical protein